MHPIFRITSSDVKALNDGQARELVARLCKAELQVKGIGTDAVTWGGDQRAKDGGVDVRVEITSGVAISGYIPKNSTVYQVKAEFFGKSKIPGEIAPKGVLRPAISDLAGKSGAYVIVSTKDDLSDLSLTERKQVMAACIEEYGLAGRVVLDFYDSRKIADWVENSPAIVAWVKSELGRSLEGWRSYGPWAYHEKNVADEYLLDDKVKIRIPNTENGVDALGAIDNLRKDISKNCSSVRIIGLSGVGKTRLIQAIFDVRIVTKNAALGQGNVLYTDLSDNPTPQPTAMLEALLLEGSESVVIVDNCGQDVHQKLTEIVKHPNSKIRLVTVEFDIRDNFPEGTMCYHVEGSSREVIAKLLKRHYPSLSDLDVGKIVEFSDGNARVAFALASTSENKDELAHLRDDELFQRLFNQKHIENDELQRCAEAASLVYSFDGDDMSKNSELAILSDVAEVTISTFYRNVSELKKRGLIQARGKWRAVLPHAISNRLALNAVESNHPSLLVKKFIIDAPERVARSFSRRLGYLHESENSKKIVEDWLKPEGFLGDVSQLGELKWEIFENIAPVNQRAALNALILAVEKQDFVAVTNPGRIHSAKLLRSLAYDSDMFDGATTALLKFSLEEPDEYKFESTTNILQSLFYSQLSGTLAPPEQRANFCRMLAFSGDARKSKIALLLLRAGLETSHFSSHESFEFGALKRGYGLYPCTLNEIHDWYRLFVQVAVDLGKASSSLGADARMILGITFRGLWCNTLMEETLTRAARELVSIDGWPEGWIGIRNTLHWDKECIASESFDRLKALEKELSPKDLRVKIQAKVLSGRSFGIDLDDEFCESNSSINPSMDWYEKGHREAETLGKAAAKDENLLDYLASFLSRSNTTDKLWHFGVGVGQDSFSVLGILDRIKALVKDISSIDIDFQFICGLINGWNKTNAEEVAEFLDLAVEDDVWAIFFPNLQCAIELDQLGHSRLMRSLELGRASCWLYGNLGYGHRTDPLTVVQISSLLSNLKKMKDGGIPTSVGVLHMVVHCASRKDERYKMELRDYCLRFSGELDWSLIDLERGNFLYQIEKIIEFSLDGSQAYYSVAETLNRLISQERLDKRKFPRSFGKVILPFLKKYPVETLDAVYVKDQHASAIRMLNLRLDRHRDTAISIVPERELIEWCRVSPEDRCIFAARTCQIFQRPNMGDSSDDAVIGISSTARNILMLAPDKKQVLEELVSRFYPGCWSGSLAAIMRQRFDYLDQLNPEGDAELSVLIDEVSKRLASSIEGEEQREREGERSEATSFE